MADINMPSGFGGLTRFKEEYDSHIKFTPIQVIVGILIALGFIFSLRIIFPLPTA
jgi:preprotein translocase subunit Sec61beta